MKKLFLLMTILLSMVISIPALAYDFTVDGIYYNYVSQEDLTCEVTFGDNKYFGDIVFPAVVNYDGKIFSVTSIGEEAFGWCSSLTSVEIPNSVTSIGDWAFESCISLITVQIPNSVTSIGNLAFGWCFSLTSVEIPNSVTSIGQYAFYGCSSLTSVDIPNSVTSIEYQTFCECSSLTSVKIPNSVTSIGEEAFGWCSSLTSVEIPNSVNSIGTAAFFRCISLTSVDIPNSVTSIGEGAFVGCEELESFTGKFASEDNRCLIVDGVLNSFAPADLTTYDISNSVTSIGVSAFEDCRSLTSVDIPNSVTSIGYLAFGWCSSLTSVEIPNSVTSIGEGAFVGCEGLESFTGKFASEDNRCLIVNGVLNSFAPANLTTYEIPNSVTSIGYDAFEGCTGLTSVTIGNSVTSIGYDAFAGCSSLNEIISLNPTPPILGLPSFRDVDKSSCVLKVPKGSVDEYKAAEEWKEFYNIEEIGGTSSIQDVTSDGFGDNSVRVFNLKGQPVGKNAKGIVIIDGKKVFIK